MKDLSREEEVFNEKNDREINSVYNFYLDMARSEIAEEDLPELADYELYRWLIFESQHLLGQYCTKIWTHARLNPTTEFLKTLKKALACAVTVMLVLVVVSFFSGGNFAFRVLAIISLLVVVFYYVIDCLLGVRISKRNDVLYAAARYQVMSEVLERKFLEDKV